LQKNCLNPDFQDLWIGRIIKPFLLMAAPSDRHVVE
jgi:hypothetical protein